MTPIWVSENRVSDFYRFSAKNLEEAKIGIKVARTLQKKDSNKIYKYIIKARGPREGNYYDTPRKNATHFDIYCYDYPKGLY